MQKLIVISILCLLFLNVSSKAQLSNLRQKKIAAKGIILLDSLSIVPGSLTIGVDTAYYYFNPVESKLFWKKNLSTDSVSVSYRVFPFNFSKKFSLYSYDSVLNNFKASAMVTTKPNAQNSIFNFGKLDYNGSFGRSISFGNNQDAVFNSQFNLLLNGFIGDSIELSAAISDNNIPIQPEGTTQQLNEFDKVLLQFKKPSWEVQLGDIDLRQQPAYFLHFYKRLQGISFLKNWKVADSIHSSTLFSGAISKGKFARNIFQGSEGNQGPYKLTGNNNEAFFIILGGTEKVFIDGVQMQRGEDQDYVINYNTAEISFTPRQMITKDKRIQVEFEYADRNYLNSMLYVSNETKFGNRFSLTASVYSNSDAKNSPINQPLDKNQKQFLSNIGDSIQNAYYPYAAFDSFSASRIMYKKIDTVYGSGLHDSIYVFSTSPDSARYSLVFSEVGLNKGNYVPVFSSANGQVFKWIAPLDGIPQGSYEPAIFLVTPKKHQLVSVAGSYQLNEKTYLNAEVAFSKYEVNTFSIKDKTNDVGGAVKLSINRVDSIGKTRKSLLNTAAGYEFVHKLFQPVERIRPVEFSRDWGLPLLTKPADEQLSFIAAKLSDPKGNLLEYKFDTYLRSDGFKGFRNVLSNQSDFKGWKFAGVFNLTNTVTPENKGYLFRPSIDLKKTFPSLKNYSAGINYSVEHNENRYIFSDTLTPLSYAYETITTFIRSDNAKRNNWSFQYFTRKNKSPFQKELLQTDRSHNFNLQAQLLENKNHQFIFNITYRQLLVKNLLITTLKPENSLLARVEYMVNEWKGFLKGNALYEIGSGQEPKRVFTYVEVPAGQGQYAWIDYNEDGIPQLNEFVIAIFPDQAKYIRIYTPSTEYIKANYTQFNYALTLQPKNLASVIENEKFKNIITRFTLQSSIQSFKKEMSQGNPVFNPFNGKIADTALINLNLVLNNTLSFNRISQVWGIDINHLKNYTKALLAYGSETNRFSEFTFKGRINIAKSYMIELIQKSGINALTAPAFDDRNYYISLNSSESKFTYTSGSLFRIIAGYKHMVRKNKIEFGGESARFNTINLESKYNTLSNTSVAAKFNFTHIDYKGELNNTISYIMLDALLPGKNFLWSLEFNKRLLNNLEFNLGYEGRKPGSSPAIHTGRISIRALL